MLKLAFEQPLAASVAAELYVDRGRELEVFPRVGQAAPLIGEADFDALGTRVLALILAERDAGTLRDAPRYWNVVRAWKYLGDAAEARGWVRHVAEARAEDFAKVAGGILSYSIGMRSAGYILNRRPDEDDFSLAELHALAARHLAAADLGEADRRRLRALQEGTAGLIAADAARAAAGDSPDPEA